MKSVFALCVYVVVMASAVATAQTNPCVDPTAVTIGSFHGQGLLEAQGATAPYEWEAIVERSSSGQIAFRIDLSSLRFSGENIAVDATPTFKLFEMMSKTTAYIGTTLGYTPCPVTCDQSSTVRVSAPGCVVRDGAGIATRFTSCDDFGCCNRFYSVCCPSGPTAPSVTFISAEGPVCPVGACQSTCY